MIGKSKLAAIVFVAGIGLASPAFAMHANAIGQGPTSPLTLVAGYGNYGSSANGGGSAGYNRGVATDYRLKKHHGSRSGTYRDQMR